MKKPNIRHVLIGALSFLFVINLLYFTCTRVGSIGVVLIPLISFAFALFGFAIHFGLQTILVSRLNSVIHKWLFSAVVGFISYYSLFVFFHTKFLWWNQYDYPENLIILCSCFSVPVSYLLLFWIVYSERNENLMN
jgi:hypothetical protein